MADRQPEPAETTPTPAFEELARKLLSVSKTDFDEARAREDAEKG
jgi:hypothetical protein